MLLIDHFRRLAWEMVEVFTIAKHFTKPFAAYGSYLRPDLYLRVA